MKNKLLLVGLSLILLFTGCENSDKETVENHLAEREKIDRRISIIEDDKIDFSEIDYIRYEKKRNYSLEDFLDDYLNDSIREEREIKYFYNYIDLNNDGKEEVFVYLLDSSNMGKNKYGTGIIVDDSYDEALAVIRNIGNPVVISRDENKGFKDIIISIKDEKQGKIYKRLSYDGTTYPESVDDGEILESGKINGVAIISNKLNFSDGWTL